MWRKLMKYWYNIKLSLQVRAKNVLSSQKSGFLLERNGSFLFSSISFNNKKVLGKKIDSWINDVYFD